MLQEKNDFITNTEDKKSSLFTGRFKKLLYFAIFLTGLISCFAIPYIIYGLYTSIWNDMGIAKFLSNVLFMVCIICCFITLILMSKSQKPFSKVLVSSMYFIGIMYVIASALFPHLPDVNSGMIILNCDGPFFTIGILFCLLGSLLKEGFRMQTEIDEIL